MVMREGGLDGAAAIQNGHPTTVKEVAGTQGAQLENTLIHRGGWQTEDEDEVGRKWGRGQVASQSRGGINRNRERNIVDFQCQSFQFTAYSPLRAEEIPC